MSRSRLLALAILVPFTIYSTIVTVREGYAIFFTGPWTHPVWTQEFLDLSIALLLVASWMVSDAKKRGVRVWPYLIATPLLGSIAPLAYLVLRDASSTRHSPTAL